MKTELATFGAGCFWCVEAIFSSLEGVLSVLPGYCGGHKENPSYEDVCADTTGHAEVCHIQFDSSKITFKHLLEVFWKVHDPTTLNQQGEDIGSQYRSVIFYHSADQEKSAKNTLHKLDESKAWDKPIVTSIEPFVKFYEAEDYHKNYFTRNPNQQYCAATVRPKVEKFKQAFRDSLK